MAKPTSAALLLLDVHPFLLCSCCTPSGTSPEARAKWSFYYNAFLQRLLLHVRAHNDIKMYLYTRDAERSVAAQRMQLLLL
jgi:hypothetical protein